jgi:hypothetical protein
MKTRIFFGIVFIGMTTIFQGCYTILDIPEGNNDGYVTTYQYVPYFPDGTLIETPPPTYSPPSNGTDQPVTTTRTNETKDRTNGNGNIRNEGNGRGNTGRDSEFTRTSTSNSGSTQTSTSNTTSNSNTRSSSNTGNSGNGRR